MPALQTAPQNAACDAIVDLVDAGTPTPGYIEIRDSTTVLAVITLQDPAFGSAVSGVATIAGTPIDSAAAVATGTADNAKLYDGNGTLIMDLSVGVSGTDIIIDSTAVATSDTVRLTSGTITMPAGSI